MLFQKKQNLNIIHSKKVSKKNIKTIDKKIQDMYNKNKLCKKHDEKTKPKRKTKVMKRRNNSFVTLEAVHTHTHTHTQVALEVI